LRRFAPQLIFWFWFVLANSFFAIYNRNGGY
jgi:hypothetical protein